MIRKYHNHTPQTNPQHQLEEPQSTDYHKTSEIQLKQSLNAYLLVDLKSPKIYMVSYG